MSACLSTGTLLEPGLHMSKEDGEPLAEAAPYARMVGSMLYLAISTRPDISYAVGELARFMSAPMLKV